MKYIEIEPSKIVRRAKPVDPYAELQDAEAFYSWWKVYSDFCKEIPCSPGDKKSAAIAWIRLEKSGVDMARVVEGTTWDMEDRISSPRGFRTSMPYGCRYLQGGGKNHLSPYWKAALDRKNESYGKPEIKDVNISSPRKTIFLTPPIQIEEKDFAANQGWKAPHEWNGLKFRSLSEVRIAEALDHTGVLFFPNCTARLGGKNKRCSKEPDFLICHNGKWGILEVDGEAWHQTAAKDHDRDRLFMAHGVSFIQRYDAKECYENPSLVVKKFLALMNKFYLNRS